MKIGILTFQYGNNYGGLLQAYALTRVTKKLGFNPTIINRMPNKKRGPLIYLFLKKLINFLFHRKDFKSFQEFRRDYLIPKTMPIYDETNLASIVNQFDAVIVGSDQIWRMDYTNAGFNYFLDFVPENTIKISYAASFGKDRFVGNSQSIQIVKKLLCRFNAVSVREDTGVDLCKELFNIHAIQLIDPTLLLDEIDYIDLINEKSSSPRRKYVGYYFLDSNTEKSNLSNQIASYYHLDLYNISLRNENASIFGLLKIHKSKDIYHSFSSWLAGIRNADFVVTDSFHGIAFSIIFKKQFLCFGNKKRGLTRMNSILKVFGLMDRLIYEGNAVIDFNSLLTIDYDSIHGILFKERDKAIKFLKNNLEMKMKS